MRRCLATRLDSILLTLVLDFEAIQPTSFLSLLLLDNVVDDVLIVVLDVWVAGINATHERKGFESFFIPLSCRQPTW